MIRLIDGTEWNDDDKHAQYAQRHGCTRAQAKNYLLLKNYSTTMSLSELYGATRAGGKGTMLAEEIIGACADLRRVIYMGRGRGMSKSLLGEAQARFLAQKPERPRMLPQQRIVWDEMGLVAKDWYRIDENGVVCNMGIDWAAGCDPNAGYAVVRRITKNSITLEVKDGSENQAAGIHPLWSTGRGRHGPRTSRARINRLRGAELLLHRWGSDLGELLRGIREREAADGLSSARVRIHPRGNDGVRFRTSSRT